MSTNRPKTLPSELLRNSRRALASCRRVARKCVSASSASASFIIAKQFEARATTAKEIAQDIDNSYSVLKVLTFEYLKEDPTEMWDFFLCFDILL